MTYLFVCPTAYFMPSHSTYSSTKTTSALPVKLSLYALESSSSSSISTSLLSLFTLSGIWFSILSAIVPFLLEYLNTCISKKLIFSRYFLVIANSSSVSPGNPTMTSVVMAGLSKNLLIFSTPSRNSSVSYLLFILLSVSSQPLWSDKWKCGHICGIAESLSRNVSVMILGSSEPSLILSIPSTAAIASSTCRSLSAFGTGCALYSVLSKSSP